MNHHPQQGAALSDADILIDAEMAAYFDGAYSKASDTRDRLERFAAAILAAADRRLTAEQPVKLNIIRNWPDGFQGRLQDVWEDVVSFIPNVKLYDLQRVLAEFGFRMEVYEGAPVTAEQGGADVEDFKHWLNARRDQTVSEVFHDTVEKYTAARAALPQPQAEPRKDGSISFEEAQDLARRHAKAEPESYYSEPFEPHLWVINAIVEASATWYERAVQERVRRVKAEAATAQPQAEPADSEKIAAVLRYCGWVQGDGTATERAVAQTVAHLLAHGLPATPTAPTEPT